VPSPVWSLLAVRGRVLDRQRCFRQLTKRGFKNLPQEFIKGNYEQYWFVYCIFYNGVNQKSQIIGFLADLGDFMVIVGFGSLPRHKAVKSKRTDIRKTLLDNYLHGQSCRSSKTKKVHVRTQHVQKFRLHPPKGAILHIVDNWLQPDLSDNGL
jgi:hypothetical protein